MRVAVVTLGCRVNQSESSDIEGSLRENGATIVRLEENPDVCIVNTCTVTARSDYTSRQMIRRAARSGARVIVTGCYSELRPEEVQQLPAVAKIFPNSDKLSIVSFLVGEGAEPEFAYSTRSRPHLKVQDGCNHRCSYCAVPLARGPSRSLPPDEVLERAKAIERRGCHEVVLTGIHLGSYGLDLRNRFRLSSLLRSILLETGIARVRLSSIEVNELDDVLIELLQDSRVCSHLHVPLQSGSDRILRLMNRSYSSATYARMISRILSRLGNPGLGTDVIVGFPGEGDADFGATRSLLEEIPFSYFHVFPFSPRPFTKAESMGDRVADITVRRRREVLLQLGAEKKRLFQEYQIGKVHDLLIEETEPGKAATGTAGNYAKISVCSDDLVPGSLVLVRVEALREEGLEGHLIPRREVVDISD